MFDKYFNHIMTIFADEDPMFLTLLWNAYCEYTGQDEFIMDPLETLPEFTEKHDMAIWEVVEWVDNTPGFLSCNYIGISPESNRPCAYPEKPTRKMLRKVATAAAFALINRYANPEEELPKVDGIAVATCFPGSDFLDEIIKANEE